MWKPNYIYNLRVLLLIIVPVTIIIYLSSAYIPVLRQAENWLRDLRIVLLTPQRPQNPDIVLILVTEDTLSQFPYRSPIDRGMLSDLVQTIDATGARAIGIDILFDQPSELDKDRRLATVLKSIKTPVVIAGATEHAKLTNKQRAYLDEFAGPLNQGFVDIPTDPIDGTVRHALTRSSPSNDAPLGFAAKIAALLGTVTPKPKFILSYQAGREKGLAFARFPAETVKILPTHWLRDKIVLIGSNLPFSDRHRTPFSAFKGAEGHLPGVEIHAHALSQMLDGTRIRQPSTVAAIAITALMTAIGVLTAVSRVPLFLRLTLPTVTIIGYLAVAGAAFYFFLMMLPVVAPVMGGVLAAATANGVFQQKERRLRKFVRNAFAKYVSPNLVDQLVTHPEALRLQGERRDLTFVFTDLEGFTSLVERSDPEVLVSLLNRYLDGMCSIVFKYGGTIDKIVGDAVTAFFGAPLPQPDHRAKAVACAMELDRFAERFRDRDDARGVELGKTRIGIHSGIATIGNFGGDALFDYTAHGDVVNTAARLEGANKFFGTRICVSEDTARDCSDIRFRPVGNVFLKGKTVPVRVVEPISVDEVPEDLLSQYRCAFGLLESSSPETGHAFEDLARSYPDDPLVKFHLDRLRQGARDASIVLEGK